MAGETDDAMVSALETLGTTLDAGVTGGGGARSGSGGDGSSEAGATRRSFAGAGGGTEGIGALLLAAVVVFEAAFGVFEEEGSAVGVTTFARGASAGALSTGLLSAVSPALATG